MQRTDGRALDQIRPITFELGIAAHASGSVLVSMGNTRVICGVMIEEVVPRWMKEQSVSGGWLTAEYSMLPYSTTTRKPRDIVKGRVDGRSTEIQRLIGRSLRAVVDLEKLGPRTMWVDCDVLQADGGTRTASITGGFVALHLALQKAMERNLLRVLPIKHFVSAVSVGIVQGQPRLDLNYLEDFAAQTDMNCVVAEDGRFIEIQGTAEQEPFAQEEMDQMLKLAVKGAAELVDAQKKALKLR